MNPTDLVLEAASYITASGSPAANNATIGALTVSQKRTMAVCLTATMEFIAKAAPSLYKRREGAILAAPVTANVTVQDGSKEITTAYGYMEGATVNIGGLLNEIRTEGGSARLVYPYTGASGTQPAIFYSDSIILDETVSAVIGAIWPEMKAGVAYGGYSDGDFGRRGRGGNYIYPLNNREDARQYAGGRVGMPHGYWVEARLSGTTAAGVMISGTLTPDVTGLKPLAGVGDGNAYAGGNPITFLYYQSGWQLFSVDSDGQTHGWYKGSGSPSDPSGTYDPADGGVGTATVTVVAAGQSSSLRLRFAPLPDRNITIGYDVRLRAPKFVAADLGTDDTPSTKKLVVPDDCVASIVLPLFLERFAMSPWFRVDKEITGRIITNAGLARARLNEFRAQEAIDNRIAPGN